MKREFAWRIFATEFNDAQYEEKGTGEMMPSYVITPLGGKINRMFIVGVLTDVEPIGEDGGFVRAHVSDPTGVFTLYSGQYQPEITDQLSTIEIPAFVAIMGKSKAYIPEDGDIMYASIRPQQIALVTPEIRDQWIVETCKHTIKRIEAMDEALKMPGNYTVELQNLGIGKYLSDGIEIAISKYDHVDLDRYRNMLKDALQYVTEGPGVIDESSKDKDLDNFSQENGMSKLIPPEQQVTSAEMQETEDLVLKVIQSVEGKEGALWDKITEQCEKKGLDIDMIEEALNALMEKGIIYEPVLGTIKTT
jgi:RPA family protein